MKEFAKLALLVLAFLICYFLPVDLVQLPSSLYEALSLVKWYAQEHVILCLVPAFFIAGAISVFVSQAAVIKYFGAKTNKFLSYGVASISGTILAVCSCTVLPLFSSIYKRGSGLGPAIAFLYSGPAINILAIIMTARVLGFRLGLARAIGAIFFSVIIGLLMHAIFLKEERARHASSDFTTPSQSGGRSLWKNLIYFAVMSSILVFANWSRAGSNDHLWNVIFSYKWFLTGSLLAALFVIIATWFKKSELKQWTTSSWDFAKQILPLLLAGVFISGLLLGRPGHEGLIPSHYIFSLVGGNSISANFVASFIGAFMYFATLTEIPILQGLIGSGMGQGPALALLLAGPALSLPSMLVIRRYLGTKKTVVYVSLVVIMSTICGVAFGYFVE